MNDFAKLAAEYGGATASKPDYAALAKEAGAVEAERAAADKELTEANIRIPGTDVRVPKTGTINQLLITTGRGMVDLWAGGNQLVRTGEDAKKYTQEQEDDLALYKKIEKAAPVISTIGRIIGQVAPTMVVPFGAAAKGVQAVGRAVPALSLLSKAGAVTDAAIMGGVQAGLNFVPEGESRAGNMIGGAVAAGVTTKGLQYLARGGKAAVDAVSDGAGGLADRIGDRIGSKIGLQQLAGTKPAVTADDVAAALEREGIDFQGLTAKVRDGLVKQANEAVRSGAAVTPAQLARAARAEGLPAPARLTKGQMTGDRQQLRDEFNLSRTKAGQAIDDQLMAQDEALSKSLEIIKARTGGTTVAGRDAEAGRKITAPLLKQLEQQEGRVSALYKVADEAGETLQEVNPTPLIKWVEDNFAAMHSAPAMKSLVADLKKSGIVTFTDDGMATAGREPTVRELESLRKAMVKWGKADGSSGSYMGEAKRVLDDMTEGKGGELYGKARAARIELREKFEDPGIINRLVSEKSGGDRVTPFEDVFSRTVLNGSVDDMTRLKGQLLTKGEGIDTAAGVQAFKDLRAATVDYLKAGAMNNAKDEFSLNGLKKAVEAVGVEKLEVLFGKNTAKEIANVLESAKDMKAPFNKTGIYNPGTASAAVDWMDRIFGFVGAGKVGSVTASGARNLMERLHADKAVSEAAAPVESAMRAGAAATAAKSKDAARELLEMYAASSRPGRVARAAAGAAVAMPEGDER